MVKTDTKFIFVLAKLTKTWKKAHIVLPRAKEFGRAKGPGESIFQAFKGPKIQNFGNHYATSEIYYVYYKPPVLSYSEVGTYGKGESQMSIELSLFQIIQNYVSLMLLILT